MRPILPAAIAVILLVGSVPGLSVDLSPASWPEGELEHYADLAYNYDRPNPKGTGYQAIIVGAAEALAVRSGLEALKQGGSAADAAIATSLAQVVLTAGCYVSFAGVFTMTYYDAATGEVYYLDGGFNTVKKEKDPLSIPPRGTPSGRSALVPGFMAGVGAAHERFGVLPWASLFEPAIYFAEEGFRIDAMLGRAIAIREDVLARLPETREIFTSPDGDLYQSGEILKQPALVETLRRVAHKGSDEMYRGRWGKRFVQAVRAEGGRMSRRDMKKYRATWGEVDEIDYRGNGVHLPGLPAWGGELISDPLAQLLAADMAALGHYTESAEALHRLMEASRSIYVFEEPRLQHHSDAVVAIDEQGNVASVCHSIATLLWGTTGIFVDGVSIPDTGSRSQRLIAYMGPGVRLPEPVNPLIVLRNGKPVLASSSIGHGLIESTLQGVVNVLDYEMDPKEANRTPTFRPPADAAPYGTRVTRGDFEPSLIEAVHAMGTPIEVENRGEDSGTGFWIAVVVEPDGRYVAATCEDFNGLAEGY